MKQTFKHDEEWPWRWKICHGICQFLIGGEFASNNSTAAEAFPEIVDKVIANSEDTDEQLYTCDKVALCFLSLWKKSLDFREMTSKANMKTNKINVTLLLCASKTGGHKLKPLYISECWRP